MKTKSLFFTLRWSILLFTFSANLAASPPWDYYFGGRESPLTAICFSPDMKSFAAGTDDGRVLRWSLETGVLTSLQEADQVGKEVAQMAFSSDGQWLWWLEGDQLYRSNYPKLDRPEVIEAGVTAFVFSATGKYLAIGKQNGMIIVLAPDQPTYRKELNPDKAGAVKALAFSKSEKRIASSSWDGVILVRDINTAFVYKRLEESQKKKAIPTVLMFNSNDKYLIAGSRNKVQLWDVYEGKIKKSTTEIAIIHTLKMAPNGRSFFVGANNGAYYLDLESLEKIKTFLPPATPSFRSNHARSMDISADGHFLIMGCLEHAAPLWHTQYDGALLTFASDYANSNYAVFSATGDYYPESKTNISSFAGYVPRLGQYHPNLVAQVLQQIEAEKGTEAKEEVVNRAGKDYALFLAVGDYQEWGALRNPVPDAEAIATQLMDKYGFQTEVVVNPTRDQIYAQLEKYRSITFPEDGQLLVFFSGHGEFIESTGEGFIIPKEGLKSNNDRFQNTYIPHARLEKMLDAIPCRHLLVAIDACYSGTFDQEIADLKGETNFKRPGDGSKSQLIQRELEAQSRIYLTSGGKERTPDGIVHSPFAERMLEALEGEGGEDGVLTINELYTFLEKAAPKPHKGRFGKHDPNGSFLFVKQNKDQ